MNFRQKVFYWSLGLIFFLVAPSLAGGAGELAEENGVIENTQVALLLLSGLIFVVQSFRVEQNYRLIPWMGAWLSPSIIFRELDIEKLAVPQWLIWVGSGMGRNLIMGFGWIALCVLAIRSYPALKNSVGRIARSRTAAFMLAAVTLLLLGSLFDHEAVMARHGKFWEEILETIGYSLFLPAAFYSGSISKAEAKFI